MNKKLRSLIDKQDDIEMLAYEISALSKTLKRAFYYSKENSEDFTYLEFTIKIIHKKNNILRDKLEAHHTKLMNYLAKEFY